MTYSDSIPEIYPFGRLVRLLTGPAALIHSHLFTALSANDRNGSEEAVVPPGEEIPMPDEDEIFPNRKPPQEEEYLPDEEEVVKEDPKKEIDDPYFPEKNDDLPPEKRQEFPQTDPV